MRATGEWGEFFPPRISFIAYNDSFATEDFPLSREDALSRGWPWRDEPLPTASYLGSPAALPDTIAETTDEVTEQIHVCEVSGKPYKIIPQEVKLHRSLGVPMPRRCPDQRHKDRMTLRNPRKLWNRQCAKCSASMQTTYAPDRSEIVYCEKCYLEAIY